MSDRLFGERQGGNPSAEYGTNLINEPSNRYLQI